MGQLFCYTTENSTKGSGNQLKPNGLWSRSHINAMKKTIRMGLYIFSGTFLLCFVSEYYFPSDDDTIRNNISLILFSSHNSYRPRSFDIDVIHTDNPDYKLQ